VETKVRQKKWDGRFKFFFFLKWDGEKVGWKQKWDGKSGIKGGNKVRRESGMEGTKNTVGWEKVETKVRRTKLDEKVGW
jgi:hypothetical protein